MFRRVWFVPLALLALLAISYPTWLNAIGQNLVVDEPPRQADVLIVLAGNSPYRAQHAAELYHQGWAPYLLISDEAVKTHGLNTTWRELYAQGVAKIDVPREAVITWPGIAINTYEEAQKSRDMMLARGWKRAIVVTDPFHSRRAILIFRAAFRPAGLEVTVSPNLASPENVDEWWTNTDGWQRVIQEYIKLGWALVHREV